LCTRTALMNQLVQRTQRKIVFDSMRWQRIEFKIAVLVYKALNDLSPQYLADDCQLITTAGHWRLQSSSVATCDVPRTWTTLGDRSFTAAGPRPWNSLPLHLCDCELLEFRRLLKTHLFGWRSRCLVTYFRYSALYKCTYLLIACAGLSFRSASLRQSASEFWMLRSTVATWRSTCYRWNVTSPKL